MQMRDAEIVSKYKRSTNKKEQISILAQLNGCDEETIKKILIDGGISPTEVEPAKKLRRKNTKTQEKTTEKETVQEEIEPAAYCDDDFLPGAITGGEGDIDYPTLKTYRTIEELESEPEDMTEREKERLARARSIPNEVKEIVSAEIGRLCETIRKLENRHDKLVDYMNGEI